MKFFYDNLIDYDGVIVDASSEIRTLPAENVINQMALKRWKTKANLANEWIKFDLGTAKNVDHVIVHRHTFLEDDFDFYIEANNTSDFSSPLFSEQVTHDVDTFLWEFSGGIQFFRYWRLRFSKWAGDLGSRQIGRIFLGTHFATTEGPDFNGYDRQRNDLARKQKSLGGQLYSERIDRYHNHRLDFSKCKESQVISFRNIFDTVGETRSMFIQINQNTSGADEVWYVQFAKPLRARVSGFDSTLYWDVALDLEEML